MLSQQKKKKLEMAGHCINIPNLLNELVLGQRGLDSLDLVALGPQDLLSGDIDVLEKQDLDILGVERLENLGGATAGEVGSPARRRRVERSDWGGGKVLVPAVGDFALSSSGEAASNILRSRRHDGVWLFCWSRMEGQMAAGWSEDAEDVLSRNTRKVKTSRLLLLEPRGNYNAVILGVRENGQRQREGPNCIYDAANVLLQAQRL